MGTFFCHPLKLDSYFKAPAADPPNQILSTPRDGISTLS